MTKEIIILGASGSVGSKALDLAIGQGYKIKALIGGKNKAKLLEAALIAKPDFLVVQDYNDYQELEAILKPLGTKVFFGQEGSLEVISYGADLAISAVPGILGLELTLAAVKTCKFLALANKEALLYAGPQLLSQASLQGTKVLPLDSEHYALTCLLAKKDLSLVKKLILTASGGPFRDWKQEEIVTASLDQVLQHPTWKMGPKITVDSASLANKAIEIIEAHYLFNFPLNKIEAIVHRQSIVHGLIELQDGSLLMEASSPDMAFPIAAALAYPEASPFYKKLSLDHLNLTFEPIDEKKFPLFRLFLEEAAKGSLETIIINYANELAVESLLAGRITFGKLYQTILELLELTRNRSWVLSTNNYFHDLKELFIEIKSLFDQKLK